MNREKQYDAFYVGYFSPLLDEVSNNAPTGAQIALDDWPWGNTLSISYSDSQGGQAAVYDAPSAKLNWGPGMIDSDPLFVDPTIDDLHLYYTSPCRNTGLNPLFVPPGRTDFEGDPRLAENTIDMGADEFHTHLYYTGDATPGGTVDIKLVGWPASAPVILYVGSGVQDPPFSSQYGDWYLEFPLIAEIPLSPIPSNGVLVFQQTLPTSPPGPYTLPMQALIGNELTNLCILYVE